MSTSEQENQGEDDTVSGAGDWVKLTSVISEVLQATAKIFMLHAIWTWLELDICSALFLHRPTPKFIPGLLCGTLAIVPILPSWIAIVPALWQLGNEDQAFVAFVVFVLHLFGWFIVPGKMYEGIKTKTGVPPTFTGLSVVTGEFVCLVHASCLFV